MPARKYKTYKLFGRTIVLVVFCFVFAKTVFANVIINEIMYDLEGSDAGREWVEIYNDSSGEVNLSGWKFNDGSSHDLNDPSNPEKSHGGQGSLILPPNGYAILVNNAESFLVEHSAFGGTVIDTVFKNSALNNTGDILKLFNDAGVEIDSVSYDKDMGANGDGNSLQKINGAWISASSTLGTVNVAQSQNDGGQTQQQNESQNQDSGTGVSIGSQTSAGASSAPKVEEIYADAGADKVGIVGAEIIFSGKAFGLQKKPLEGARYLWNFGDGSAMAEGQNVNHVYKFPADYVVSLSAASAGYSASDTLNIKIIPNGLSIVEANSEFVKVRNSSNFVLDLSGWYLSRSGGEVLKFPQSTFVKANTDLPFVFLAVKNNVGENNAGENKGEIVKLFYPNGGVASEFKISSFSATSSVKSSMADKSNATNTVMVSKISVSNSAVNNTTSNSKEKSSQNLPADDLFDAQIDNIYANQQAGAGQIISKNSGSSMWPWLSAVAFLGLIGGICLVAVKKNSV